MSDAARAPQPLDIAIIGMAGAYAGAPDMHRYWQNILDKVDAVGDAPEGWSHDNYDPASDANDRIYTRRGGFLGKQVPVDPIAFGVLPSVAAGGDPDHLIALTHARDALLDAGLYDPKTRHTHASVIPERAGVILGRGTYGNRGMASMIARGLFVDQAMAIARGLRPDLTDTELAELRRHFKQQLPPYSADMVGPLTPNVVAGMIANRLNLMGPSFIVDAACASTLIAVDAAVRELVSGHCDLMITGGVQSQTPAQLYIQFCRINALSHGNIRPFQKGADGTLLGEGVGLLVLKRRADAERDGNRIYAVIQGIGTSSDGRAKGFLAPRQEGQVLALERAYASSGIDPATIGYIEAHGTGTAVGDHCEIASLRQMFGTHAEPHIALGSVKSMIGHCLPAAASASLIKTALALHHKVLPPMLCDAPDPALDFEHSPFYVNNETRPWIHAGHAPRRAGVNAFGFGGANAHVILEEYRLPHHAQVTVLHRPRPSEFLAFAAPDLPALRQRAQLALRHLQAGTSLAAVACGAARHAYGDCRLAIVANGADDAATKIARALEKLAAAGVQPFKTRSGLFYGHGAAPGKLCFLYPGEGAQYPNMLADLCVNFPCVRRWFDFLEQSGRNSGKPPRAPVLFPAPTGLDAEQRGTLEQRLYGLDVAAESVYCATLGVQALLDELHFSPDAMLGHSTGENTAITACGIYRPRHADELADVVRGLNDVYDKLASEGRIADGTLLTVGGLRDERRRALLAEYAASDDAGRDIVVAMDNCPNQLVVFGTPLAIDALRTTLSAEGAICAVLPFGRAYHTARFTPMAKAVEGYFDGLEFGAGRCALYSACQVGPFPRDAAGIRKLAAAQWNHPVRFTDTLRRLYDDGYRVFLELGPSANLTAFVADSLRDHKDIVAVSCDNRRRGGVLQLHHALAQLFAAGVTFEPAALYAHCDVEPADLAREPPAARPAPITVTLEMPRLSLPENWAPLQRAPAAPPPAAAATLPAAANCPAPARADPRMALLRSHFSLMDSFLASQSRVLQQLAGGGSAQPRSDAFDAAFPLLGHIVSRDGTRLEAHRHFDLRSDSFLRDHAIGGRPGSDTPAAHALAVIPFTFSMEIAAEAATALLGDDGLVVSGLDAVRGNRWLPLDDDTLDIVITAERLSDAADGQTRTQVRIHTADEVRAPAFEATVVAGRTWPPAPAALAWSSQQALPPRANPDGELYRHGMFHGPRLQGVARIQRWGERSLDAELTTLPVDDYFTSTATPRFQLDAALLDAAGSLVAYWVAERENWASNCFPFAIASLRQYGPPHPAGERLLGRVDARDDAGVVSADFDIIDPATNTPLVRITGWQDRKFATDARFHAFRLDPRGVSLSTPHGVGDGITLMRMEPFAAGFLDQGGGIWMRVLAHLVLHPTELPEFAALPKSGPRREEWLMGRIAVKDAVRTWARTHAQRNLAGADIRIFKDARGRPHADVPALGAPLTISLSHSERWGFGAAARGPLVLGVDYQRPRPVDTQALATGALDAGEQRWLQGLTPRDAASRLIALWCAKEAAAKAAGTGLEGRPHDWHVTQWSTQGERSHARVCHGQDEFNIDILHTAGGECVAWCRHASPQELPQPLPVIATV